MKYFSSEHRAARRLLPIGAGKSDNIGALDVNVKDFEDELVSDCVKKAKRNIAPPSWQRDISVFGIWRRREQTDHCSSGIMMARIR